MNDERDTRRTARIVEKVLRENGVGLPAFDAHLIAHRAAGELRDDRLRRADDA